MKLTYMTGHEGIPIKALRKSISAVRSNGDVIMTGDGHKNWIAGLDFHPRSSHLVTASDDGTVKLWSFAKSKCAAAYTEPCPISRLSS